MQICEPHVTLATLQRHSLQAALYQQLCAHDCSSQSMQDHVTIRCRCSNQKQIMEASQQVLPCSPLLYIRSLRLVALMFSILGSSVWGRTLMQQPELPSYIGVNSNASGAECTNRYSCCLMLFLSAVVAFVLHSLFSTCITRQSGVRIRW